MTTIELLTKLWMTFCLVRGLQKAGLLKWISMISSSTSQLLYLDIFGVNCRSFCRLLAAFNEVGIHFS